MRRAPCLVPLAAVLIGALGVLGVTAPLSQPTPVLAD